VPALYQRLLGREASYEELGNRILRQIKAAHAFRQVVRVRELAELLVSFPIREFHLIGLYYLVWCEFRELKYHPNILEGVAEQTQTYKAQALVTRAALEVHQGKFERALYFYTEALRTNPTVSDFIHISTGIARVKSMEGFNRSALADLERLVPLLRYAEPLTHLIAINSYAVELSETGRLAEAQTVSLVAMSSPLAPFYPESQETLLEIKTKQRRRSIVAISRPQVEPEYEAKSEAPENVIHKARVRAVIDFMVANLHRSIALAELAGVVNLSPSHFFPGFQNRDRTLAGGIFDKTQNGKGR
jgi:tetratricopeptide (TPR) repeat protein